MRPTTIVIDTSVFLHEMSHCHSTIGHTDKHWEGLIKAQLAWLVSGDWMGGLKPQDFQVLFVCDTKDSELKYWRHRHLVDPEVTSKVPRKNKTLEKKRQRLADMLLQGTSGDSLVVRELTEDLAIHYKAGRKFPEYAFTKMKKVMLQVIREQGWRCFGQVGYEADDVAAAVVKANMSLPDNLRHRVVLLTVDSDWMGLIDDLTSWFCLHGYFPRIRGDMHSANEWAQRRLKRPLKQYRDIWDIKAQQGDKSDNLPPSNGVLLPAIDLLNPPSEHQLWHQPIGQDIKRCLQHPCYNKVSGVAAAKYVQSIGVPLAVRPLDPEKDFI